MVLCKYLVLNHKMIRWECGGEELSVKIRRGWQITSDFSTSFHGLNKTTEESFYACMFCTQFAIKGPRLKKKWKKSSIRSWRFKALIKQWVDTLFEQRICYDLLHQWMMVGPIIQPHSIPQSSPVGGKPTLKNGSSRENIAYKNAYNAYKNASFPTLCLDFCRTFKNYKLSSHSIHMPVRDIHGINHFCL